jgi:hypothetical protein
MNDYPINPYANSGRKMKTNLFSYPQLRSDCIVNNHIQCYSITPQGVINKALIII